VTPAIGFYHLKLHKIMENSTVSHNQIDEMH